MFPTHILQLIATIEAIVLIRFGKLLKPSYDIATRPVLIGLGV
jgi:hypothetical protein